MAGPSLRATADVHPRQRLAEVVAQCFRAAGWNSRCRSRTLPAASDALRLMKPEVQPNKVVVLSGSGISAESGLPTFRDSNGLWHSYSWHEVASPEGWRRHPEVVLAFYNERRSQAWLAGPNAAHEAIASLERAYEVVVITQNVDELHERAGSCHVIHLHGQLAYARSEREQGSRGRYFAFGLSRRFIGEGGKGSGREGACIAGRGEAALWFQVSPRQSHRCRSRVGCGVACRGGYTDPTSRIRPGLNNF